MLVIYEVWIENLPLNIWRAAKSSYSESHLKALNLYFYYMYSRGLKSILYFGIFVCVSNAVHPVRLCVYDSYLSNSHVCVLLLLLQLLLKKLQVVLWCQRSNRRRARAAGSNALGCHSEEGPSIEVLTPDKQHGEKKNTLIDENRLAWDEGMRFEPSEPTELLAACPSCITWPIYRPWTD